MKYFDIEKDVGTEVRKIIEQLDLLNDGYFQKDRLKKIKSKIDEATVLLDTKPLDLGKSKITILQISTISAISTIPTFHFEYIDLLIVANSSKQKIKSRASVFERKVSRLFTSVHQASRRKPIKIH